MSNILDYFKGVGKGISSLIKGMEVTGKEFVTPKVTECYPENRATLKIADRFRAELTLKYDAEGRHKCIACGICQMNCPNGTIHLETKMVDLPDGKKKRKLDKYMYDLGSCTFCMLCVTSCPQDALEFSNDFEQAVFTRDKLVKQLNYRPEPEGEPVAPAKPAMDPEKLAKIKAEALAKAAKIKAEKEAAAKAAAEANAPAAEPKAPEAAEPKAPEAAAEAKAPEAPAEAKAPEAPADEPKADNN